MMRLQFFTLVVWFWESPNCFWYWRTKSDWPGETIQFIFYGHLHWFLVHFWPRNQYQVKYRVKTWKLKMSYFACFFIDQVAPKGQLPEKSMQKFFLPFPDPKNPKKSHFWRFFGHFSQIWQNLEKARNELSRVDGLLFLC